MNDQNIQLNDTIIGTIVQNRIVDPRPVGIRWLRRSDGTTVLQYAQAWATLDATGVQWVDVPTEQEE